MNVDALKRIEEEKFKRTGKLDLSHCGLTTLPEEVGKMDWLTNIDASWNQISDISPIQGLENLNEINFKENQISDISPIQGLGNLTKITFLSNQISDISPIQGLGKLTEINFMSNQISDISPIQGLGNLTKFTFLSNKISDISPIQGLGKLTEISFSSNKISDISPIHGLENLIEIDFGVNQIRNISPIQGLSNLTEISFSSNKISDISPIHGLENLIEIDFGVNQIRNISPIQGLSNLTQITFFGNKIGDISPIQGLGNLTEIYFSNNQISNVSPIQALKNLTKIDFDENQISDISPIQGLGNLTEIWFSNNQISNISPIQALKNLTKIDFYGNQISDISPIQGLGNLTVISFWSNKIRDISPIQGLINLTEISFSDNQIRDISPIQGLINLTEISFSDNQISDITQFNFIKNLPKLIIRVNGNPIEQINNLVLKPGNNHNDTIELTLKKLEEAEIDGEEGYLPVKVLMMGNHGSGKSSLVHYLKHDNLDYTGDTTHILKIEAYKTQVNGLPMAYFYDFGGQDFYHGLYQAFLRKGLMTVMLWNQESNENKKAKEKNRKAIRHYSVPYWLGQWKRRIDGTIVLVQSHKDDIKSERKTYHGKKYKITEEFYLSLKTQFEPLDPNSQNTGALTYLGLTIRDYIIKEQNKQAGSGKISKKYYDFISYIQIEAVNLGAGSMKLSKLRPNYNVEDLRFNTEIEQLVLSGIILKYQDSVWLNPAAVVKKVHAVLSKKFIDIGVVKEKVLNDSLKDLPLLGLLIDQKVIFKHEFKKNEYEYIIPNYLPLIESSEIDYDLMVFGLDNPLFILKYEDFMPFGLINHLICHFGQLPDRKKFWRDQLIFTISKNDGEKTIHQAKIIIKLNFDALKVEVYAHFDKSCDNESFKNLVKEYIFYSILSFDDPYFSLPSFALYKSSISDIHCILNQDKKEENKYTISFCSKNEHKEDEECMPNLMHDKHLSIENNNVYISLDGKTCIRYTELLENNNKPTISSYHEDLKFYRELPAFAYQAFTPHKIEKMKKVFISYSRKDVDFKNELRNHLNLVKTLNIFDNWSCEDINFGKWDDQIQHELESSDLIVYMLSANFFSSRYILEKEVLKGMKLVEENPNKQFYCVVVRDFIGLDKLKDPNKTTSELENAILNLSNYQYGVYDYVKNPLNGQNEEKIVSLANWANQGKLDTAMTKIVEKILEFLK